MSAPQKLLAGGVPSGQPSPQEELHSTIKNLLDENSQLREKVEELEGDKRHFQRKLDEYIRSDVDEKGVYARPATLSSGDRISLQNEVEILKRENLRLNSLLSERGGSEIGNNRFTDLECNPVLMHQLSELKAARSLCVDQHERKIEAMKLEKFRLKEEVERLKRTLQLTESANLQNKRASWEALNGHFYREGAGGEGGYSSLPETLPSFSSTSSSGQSSATPSSSGSSRITSAEDPLVAEVKKLKKQLEKYKSANVELDQRLKDAHLDLRRLTEGRGGWNTAQQMDMERLEGEVSRLRAQLDQLRAENNHLRCTAGRHM